MIYTKCIIRYKITGYAEESIYKLKCSEYRLSTRTRPKNIDQLFKCVQSTKETKELMKI